MKGLESETERRTLQGEGDLPRTLEGTGLACVAVQGRAHPVLSLPLRLTMSASQSRMSIDPSNEGCAQYLSDMAERDSVWSSNRSHEGRKLRARTNGSRPRGVGQPRNDKDCEKLCALIGDYSRVSMLLIALGLTTEHDLVNSEARIEVIIFLDAKRSPLPGTRPRPRIVQ